MVLVVLIANVLASNICRWILVVTVADGFNGNSCKWFWW